MGNQYRIHRVSAQVGVLDIAQHVFPLLLASCFDISRQSINAHIIEELCQQWRHLSTVQQDTLQDYTKMRYRQITRHLLGRNRGKSGRIGDAIDCIHDALQTCAIPEDVLVFRRWMIFQPDERSEEERLFYGALRHDDGIVCKRTFSSTSISVKFSNVIHRNETQYIIRVPKGTHGLYIGGHSDYPGEDEVLLDYGLRYRVLKIYERGAVFNGQWDTLSSVIVCEIV